jgi:hypothetical protein
MPTYRVGLIATYATRYDVEAENAGEALIKAEALAAAPGPTLDNMAPISDWCWAGNKIEEVTDSEH